MDNFLYWEPCDKTITERLPYSGSEIEHHITREFKCSHPKITRAWVHGPASTIHGTPFKFYLEIITESGERYSQLVTDEEMQSGLIPKAEEWLRSIPI